MVMECVSVTGPSVVTAVTVTVLVPVKAQVREIKEKIDSESGKIIEQNSQAICEHEAATIIFETEPIVVEKFSEIPELGRFVLVRGQNIGAGIVLETRA